MRKTCLVLVALLMLVFVSAVPAQAATNVPYYDPASGDTTTGPTLNVIELSVPGGNDPVELGESGQDSWYVARKTGKNLDYTDRRIVIKGRVNLILEDDCNMIVTTRDPNAPAIDVSGYGNSLTIYGQTSDSTGKLTATVVGGAGDTRRGAAIGGRGNSNSDATSARQITINGGVITATGGRSGGAGIGGGASKEDDGGNGGTITINYGRVIATGGADGGAGLGGGYSASTSSGGSDKGGDSGTIAINGGIVHATAPGKGAAIGTGGSGRNNSGEKVDSITLGDSAKVYARATATGTKGAEVGTGARGTNNGVEALTTGLPTNATHTANVGDKVTIRLSTKTYFHTNNPTYQWQHWNGTAWGDIGSLLNTYSDHVINSVTGADAGLYRCVVNLSKSDGITYGVNAATATLTVKHAKPTNIGFDFLNHKMTGFDRNATYQIRIKNTSAWTDYQSDDDGKIGILEGWYDKTLEIIRKGSQGSHTGDSDKAEVKVPDRPDAPTSPSAIHASGTGVSDGRIIGTTDKMGYGPEAVGGGTQLWSDCAGIQVKGLAPDTYLVRTKATLTAFASKNLELVIGVGQVAVQPPTFAPVTTPYTQPNAGIVQITNAGPGNVSIQEVTLYPADQTKFSFGAPRTAVDLPVNEPNTMWSVQPNGGLSVGTHTALIVVEYTTGGVPLGRAMRLRNGATHKVAAEVSFTVNNQVTPPWTPPSGPTKSNPVLDPTKSTFVMDANGNLDGSLGISGLSGTELPLVIEIRDKDGNKILVTIEDIDGVLKDGKLDFEVLARHLTGLPAGDYTVFISSPGNASNNGFVAKKIGSFTIKGLDNWSVLPNLTAASKVSYNVVTTTGTGVKPVLTVKVDNTVAVKVDPTTLKLVGTLQSDPKLNVATVTFTDQRGTSKICKVTVVPNEYYPKNAPLRIKKVVGVFSSTYALYYNGDNLEARVAVLNKRQKTINKNNLGGLALELYYRGQRIYTMDLARWRPQNNLLKNDFAVYEITLTPEMLKNVSGDKPFELIHGAYEAVITRKNITPVLAENPNAVSEANGTMKKAVPAMIVKASPEIGD